jgi:hypothetical protein
MRTAKQAFGKAHRGNKATNWKGGSYLTRGYRVVTLEPKDSPFRSMTKAGRYVAEHRLILARSLRRPLKASEIVHHRNGVKADNRLSNLELTDNATHKRSHAAILRELRSLRRENERLRSALRVFRRASSNTSKQPA